MHEWHSIKHFNFCEIASRSAPSSSIIFSFLFFFLLPLNSETHSHKFPSKRIGTSFNFIEIFTVYSSCDWCPECFRFCIIYTWIHIENPIALPSSEHHWNPDGKLKKWKPEPGIRIIKIDSLGEWDSVSLFFHFFFLHVLFDLGKWKKKKTHIRNGNLRMKKMTFGIWIFTGAIQLARIIFAELWITESIAQIHMAHGLDVYSIFIYHFHIFAWLRVTG